MLDCKLNKNQINFFHTFGFILFKGLFLDKIDDINISFEEVWKLKTKKQKINFTKIERLCIPQFIDLHNNLTNLLDDERIINIGESILGNNFNYMGSDGNYYNSNTSWHSDGWESNILHIKLAFYLDHLKHNNGCLKVLPGSHHIHDKYSKDLDISQLGLLTDGKTGSITNYTGFNQRHTLAERHIDQYGNWYSDGQVLGADGSWGNLLTKETNILTVPSQSIIDMNSNNIIEIRIICFFI